MHVTVSIPDALAYGADEAQPSRPQALSIDDAVYHAVHGAPGGVSALAARMGMSANTLTHKANPNTTSHHMRPAELVALQQLGGQHQVLHSMAHALGYTCTRATPDLSDGDPVEAVMRLTVGHADLMRALADALQAGQGSVSPNQMRRAEAMAQEAIATTGHALSTLRTRLRRTPGSQA